MSNYHSDTSELDRPTGKEEDALRAPSDNTDSALEASVNEEQRAMEARPGGPQKYTHGCACLLVPHF
jgi:hypothetical protein